MAEDPVRRQRRPLKLFQPIPTQNHRYPTLHQGRNVLPLSGHFRKVGRHLGQRLLQIRAIRRLVQQVAIDPGRFIKAPLIRIDLGHGYRVKGPVSVIFQDCPDLSFLHLVR